MSYYLKGVGFTARECLTAPMIDLGPLGGTSGGIESDSMYVRIEFTY